jgi:hypothetical protein
VMQSWKTPSVIAATPSAQKAKAMFCQREEVMENCCTRESNPELNASPTSTRGPMATTAPSSWLRAVQPMTFKV